MGVKPFDIRGIGRTGLINPKQIGYQDSLDIIREELHRTRRSFVKIGWYLKHIREKEMYREENYANIYELAADKFNLSQPTATRFMNICEQFSIGHDSPELDEKYTDFSMSQLFEMLPMKQEEMKQITPDMTVTQIRDFKKKGRERTKSENEDIPGQTSIQEDFKKFMPDGYEERKIIDSEYREIAADKKEKDTEDTDKPPDEEEGNIPAEPIPDTEPSGKTAETEGKAMQELPLMKNNDQRKEWLENYKKWGMWYYDNNIDVVYYKYDFPDGSRLVVAEYPQREMSWCDEKMDEAYYHFLQKDKPKYGSKTYDEKYRHNTDSISTLTEYLKNIQRTEGGKNGKE